MEQAPILFSDATTTRDETKATLLIVFHKIEVEGNNQVIIKVMQMQISTP